MSHAAGSSDLRRAGHRCQAVRPELPRGKRVCSSDIVAHRGFGPPTGVLRKCCFTEADQRDLGRPVPSAKICLFPSDPNHLHISRRLVPSEGRLAIVTNAGRDAVDADGADNERRLRRTAKPCGPDAPTLASSVADVSARRWWQESPVTRESAEQAVKTIARGMPGDSGVTVVTNACAFYLRARGCGRAERPAFPAPLLG
jgi:hypothetical protein